MILFTFFVNIGLGLLVFLKRPSAGRVNIAFSIASWASAVWILGILMAHISEVPSLKIFWGRVVFGASGIIPTAFLCFSYLFPRQQRRLTFSRLLLICLPLPIFLGLSFTNQIVSSLGSGSRMFHYGPFYPLFSIYLVSYICVGLIFLVITFKTSIGLVRLQTKYCLLGLFLLQSLR